MINWHKRWQERRVGFHKNTVNMRLKHHLSSCSLTSGARILIPLCGKSIDMKYLSSLEYEVIGVDISEIAISLFFREQNLDYTSNGTTFTAIGVPITLYNKSIFDVSSEEIGNIDLVYDRAALLALDVIQRQHYAKNITDITHHAPMLLLSLYYDQALMSGPPFAVSEEEIRALYSEYNITQLDSYDDIDNEVKFRSNGLPYIYKESYLLR